MADNNTVARPYAQAVFEVARENAALDELSVSLDAARELLGDGQVVAFLGQPSLNDDQRLAFLQGLFAEAVGSGSVFAGGSQHGTNFLKLLLENGRVAVLPEISAQFEALKAKVENSIDAVITAAAPLSAAQEQAIANSLAAKLGRDVRIGRRRSRCGRAATDDQVLGAGHDIHCRQVYRGDTGAAEAVKGHTGRRDIVAGFQQMGRKAVAKCVGGNVFQSRLIGILLHNGMNSPLR